MTMSEMVCCAEHHGECEMAGMAGSCCETDQHADAGMFVPERLDDTLAPTADRSVMSVLPFFIAPYRLARAGAESRGSFHDLRRRFHLAHTVLLI